MVSFYGEPCTWSTLTCRTSLRLKEVLVLFIPMFMHTCAYVRDNTPPPGFVASTRLAGLGLSVLFFGLYLAVQRWGVCRLESVES